MLTNQKVVLLDKIYGIINHDRVNKKEGLTNQNYIYFSKYLEAKEILEKNIQSDDTLEYPYTTGYANVKGCDLQTSAKQIVLQYNLTSGFLAESENIRIKYQDLIINESDISKLKPLLEQFNIEYSSYGKL
jgi:hypothetical protein